jgi:hypothetical protein
MEGNWRHICPSCGMHTVCIRQRRGTTCPDEQRRGTTCPDEHSGERWTGTQGSHSRAPDWVAVLAVAGKSKPPHPDPIQEALRQLPLVGHLIPAPVVPPLGATFFQLQLLPRSSLPCRPGPCAAALLLSGAQVNDRACRWGLRRNPPSQSRPSRARASPVY